MRRRSAPISAAARPPRAAGPESARGPPRRREGRARRSTQVAVRDKRFRAPCTGRKAALDGPKCPAAGASGLRRASGGTQGATQGMDRIRIVGGAPLNGTIPISGAKNAALPADDREPPHRRDADPRQRAAPCRRRRSSSASSAITASTAWSTASAPARTACSGETLQLSAARDRRHHRALRARLARCGRASG